MQSWSGSGPELFVLRWDPTTLLFSQEVLPCSCSDMRFQGVWAGSGQGLQGQHQKKNPRPRARRSPNPNSKRGCTRGGQPTPCMLSQVSIHSTRFGPLPQVWTGQGGPGLSERHGHMHVCRDPGCHTALHTVPGDSDSQSRASVSQGERNCSAPQSLFTWEAMSEVCALHPKSLDAKWACCGRHNLSWETLSSEPGQQGTGEGLSSEARRKTPILASVLGQATWPPPASFPQSSSQPSTIFPGAQAFQKPGAILDPFPHTHVL